MRLALFDIDGTLLQGRSSERRFAAWLWRQRVLGPRQLGCFLLFVLQYGLRFGSGVLRKNKAYLSGLSLERIEPLARSFVHHEMLGSLNGACSARLAEHLRSGDEVVLLSGTPEFIARPLAEHLGVSRVAATRCAQREGVLRAAPPLEHPYGAAKIFIARRISAELGLPLETAVAYGDSAADLQLLEAVGTPVAVTPGRSLRRVARRRSWEIMDQAPAAQLSPSGSDLR